MIARENKIYNLLIILKEEIMQELQRSFITPTPNDELDKIMTSKEVCVYYQISSSTLERYIRKGLKFHSSGNRTKRIFKKSEVEVYFTKK